MADHQDSQDDRHRKLLADIDLLLDDEAGPEGARLLAEMEEDPEARALLDYSRTLDLALRNAMPEVEPPEGMWARFEVRLAKEPPPRFTLLDRIQIGMAALVRLSRQPWAVTGTAFLFLITCGTLWWDGSIGFVPIRPPAAQLRPVGLALERSLSDALDQEAVKALDELMIDQLSNQTGRRLDEGLRGAGGAVSGDPAKAGPR